MSRFTDLLLTVLVAAFTLTVSAAPPPLELKGLTPGMTRNEINELYPGQCRFLGEDDWARGCDNTPYGTLGTIASEEVQFIDLVFIEGGKLGGVYMMIKPSSFSAISSAMTTKFGKPLKADRSVVENRVGVKFQQEILIWKRGGRTLEIRKYTNNLDTGTIFMGSDEFMKNLSKSATETARRRQNDL